MAKSFLDTNVLVYACDEDTPAKKAIAQALLRNRPRDESLCISTQVLQEFYVATTRKLDVEPLRAKDLMRSFRHMEIAHIDPDDINRAIDGSIIWQISFWDALILVAAIKLRCAIVYSEDLNPGQHFESVRIINPFA